MRSRFHPFSRSRGQVLLAAILLVWLPACVWFYQQVPLENYPTGSAKADAIVVLTGGIGRVERGVKLLKSDRGDVMFITGVGRDVKLNELANVLGMDSADPVLEGAHPRIVLGREATNTVGNAQETAAWLEAEGYRSFYLVTSYYHMPRSLLEFREANPDATILPAPVFHEKAGGLNGVRLIFLEFHKYALRRGYHFLKNLFGGGD